MSLIGVIITLILVSLGNFIISIINLIFTYINNYNFIKLNNKKELILKEFFKIKKFHKI